MEEFEPSSRLAVEIVGVRAQFEAWSRDWRSSSPLQVLETGLEEFEPGLRLVVGIVGVRAQFEDWSRDWMSSSSVRGLAIVTVFAL